MIQPRFNIYALSGVSFGLGICVTSIGYSIREGDWSNVVYFAVTSLVMMVGAWLAVRELRKLLPPAGKDETP